MQRDKGVLHDFLSGLPITKKTERQPHQVGGVPMKEDGHRVVPVQNKLRHRPGATALATLPGHGHLRRLSDHTPLVA